MKRLNYYCTIIAIILTAASCLKKPNTPVVYTPTTITTVTPTGVTGYNYTDINALKAAIALPTRTYTVRAGQYTVITTNGGNRLVFYSNSFKDAAGNILTSGNVDIEVLEASGLGNIIRSQAMTVDNNGQMLRSGGEMRITATMAGQPVFANKYGVQFKAAATTTQPMELYYGTAATIDTSFSWLLGSGTTGSAAAGTNTLAIVADSVVDTASLLDTTLPGPTYTYTYTYNPYFIFDSCTNFNWINCDHFMGSGGTLTQINIILPDTSFNPCNTSVYVIFPTDNSAMEADENYGINRNHYKAINIPVGISAKIFTMTNKGGNYYYSLQTGLTVTSGMTVTPSPEATSLSAILTVLASL